MPGIAMPENVATSIQAWAWGGLTSWRTVCALALQATPIASPTGQAMDGAIGFMQMVIARTAFRTKP
jgi:1,4-dihydroxy-2-naphthoyl-CoA synthase